MHLGLSGRQKDAAKSTHLHEFLADLNHVSDFSAYAREYTGKRFDLFAFVPVINLIHQHLDEISEKYKILDQNATDFAPESIELDPQDADIAVQCFNGLTWLQRNCINLNVSQSIMFFLDFKPQYWASLIKNTDVALAAAIFGVSFGDDGTLSSFEVYNKTREYVSRVPLNSYGNDYLHYLAVNPEDVDLVALDIARSLYQLKQVKDDDKYAIPRYLDVLNPHLLTKFPKLCVLAETVLTFTPHDPELYNLSIKTKLQQHNLAQFALEQKHSSLLTAIVEFHTRDPTFTLFSEASLREALKVLEASISQHSSLDLQIAILRCFKVNNPCGLVVLSQLLERQLQFTSGSGGEWRDVEVAKGLLFLIGELLEEDRSESAVPILEKALSVEALQVLAVKALVKSSSVNSMRPELTDPLALILFYEQLDLQNRKDYQNQVVQSIYNYANQFKHYSQEYYSTLAKLDLKIDAKELLKSSISQLTRDESSFDTRGRLFRRESLNQKIVDHCIWALASTQYGDLCTEIDLVLDLLSHKNLPFEYFWSEHTNRFLHKVVQPFANATSMAKLLATLEKALKDKNVRLSMAVIACIWPLENIQPLTELICENGSFNQILRMLPFEIRRLCHLEAEFLQDPIVQCFWAGPHEMLTGLPQANTNRWQFGEMAAANKLGVDYEKYESVRGAAKLTRFAKARLADFGEQLKKFCAQLAMVETFDAKSLTEPLYTSYINAMGTCDVDTIDGRYAFMSFSEYVDSREQFGSQGLKMLVDQYVRLHQVEPQHQQLKCYTFQSSNYVKECFDTIDNKLNSLEGEYSSGIDYLLKQTIGKPLPDCFSLSAKGVDACFVESNYEQILSSQPIGKVLSCATFLTGILGAKIDALVPQLCQGISLALLAALLDLRPTIEVPSIDSVVASLDSEDPIIAMCAAKVLLKNPVKGVVPPISKHTEPETLTYMLELTSCLLVNGQLDPVIDLVGVVDHCFARFGKRNFDKTSLYAFVCLIDMMCNTLQADPVIRDQTMAHVIKSMGLTTKKKIASAKLLQRPALQPALDQYFAVDGESVVFTGLSEWVGPSIHAKTAAQVDALLGEYISIVPHFYKASVRLSNAYEAREQYEIHQMDLETLAWGSSTYDQLTSEVNDAWYHVRTIYLRLQVYSAGLTLITNEDSTATKYLVSHGEFSNFVRAAVSAGGAASLHDFSELGWCPNKMVTCASRSFVFWPLVNLLNNGYQNAVFDRVDISNPDVASGLLYILQNAAVRFDKVGPLPSNIVQSIDKFIDLDHPQQLEKWFLMYLDKFNRQNDEAQTVEENNDEKQPEIDPIDELFDESDEHNSDEDVEILEIPDFDSDEYESDEYNEEVEEFKSKMRSVDPFELVSGPFDEKLNLFLPGQTTVYSMWKVNVGGGGMWSESSDCSESDSESDSEQAEPTVGSWEDEQELSNRGLDLAPPQTLETLIPQIKFPFGVNQFDRWPKHEKSYRFTYTGEPGVEFITRTWPYLKSKVSSRSWPFLRSKVSSIDWSNLRAPEKASSSSGSSTITKLDWPRNLALELCKCSLKSIPNVPASSSDLVQVLNYLTANASSMSGRAVHRMTDCLTKSTAINTLALLKIIDLPVFTRIEVNYSAVAATIRQSAETRPSTQPLKNEIMSKLVTAFYAPVLVSLSKINYMAFLQVLMALKYIPVGRFQHLVQDHLESLMKAVMNNKEGASYEESCSDLEAVLTVLKQFKLCRLDLSQLANDLRRELNPDSVLANLLETVDFS